MKKNFYLLLIMLLLSFFEGRAQKYNLDINGSLENSRGKTGSFEVIINGTIVKDYRTNSASEDAIRISETINVDAFTSLQIKGFFNTAGVCNTFEQSPIVNLITSITSPLTVTETRCFFARLEVIVRPDIPSISKDSPSGTELCIGSQLTLRAGGATFPNPDIVYNWQYSTEEGSTWTDFPSAYNGIKTTTATIEQIIGPSHIDFLNTDIQFRIGNFGRQYAPNIVTVRYSPCAPLVTKLPDDISPNCSGDSVDIAVTFDRALERDNNNNPIELFDRISIVDVLDSGLGFGQQTDVGMDTPTGRIFTFNDIQDLEDGRRYQIVYQMKKKDVTVPGFVTSTETFLYNDPTPVTFTATGVNTLCFNQNSGEIDITANGGAGNYEYSTNNGTTYFPFDNANTHQVTGLTAGNYQVKIKDAKGCTEQILAGGTTQDKVVPIAITEPKEVIINGGPTPVSGNGLSDGAVTIFVDNAVGMINYTWTKAGDPTFSESTPNLTGIREGSYTVLVRDGNGCTATNTFIVTEPELLSVIISITTPLNCFGDNNGALLATVNGGATGIKTLQWQKRNAGIYQNIVGETNTTLFSQTAGDYRVIVTDVNTNTNQDDEVLPPPPELSFFVNNQTNINCFGDNTGALDISVTGGTGTYTYQWSGGSTATTQDIDGLTAGDYVLTVTDSNLCSVNNIFTPFIIIGPNESLKFNNPQNNIQIPSANDASDGAIDIEVEGGSPNYTYNWTKIGDTTFNRTTQDIDGITAGDYSVLVTDAKGCTIESLIVVSDPRELTVLIKIVQSILCNGEKGRLDAEVDGGVVYSPPRPGYDYEWFNITSGTPLALGITTAIANDLSAGTYRVIAKDKNGITVSAEQTLSEPLLLTFSNTSSSDVLCFEGNDGSATVTVSGGVPIYSYSWTKTGDTSYSASTAAINNLTAGTYTIMVLDVNNCLLTRSFIIEQPTLAVTIALNSITNVAIAGQNTGAIAITVSGGTSSYTYLWAKTNDTSFNEITEDISNLTAGEYTIFVSDNNAPNNDGCIASETFTITEPLPLSVSIIKNLDILCNGDNNGELTANPNGGVGGYSYNWFKIVTGNPNPVSLNINTAVISNLDAGEYQVVVTDNNGAAANDSYILTSPKPLSASIKSITNVLCFGDTTGAIALSVGGGTGVYSFVWLFDGITLSDTTQSLSQLSAGNYTVIITDGNGCEFTFGPIAITQTDKPLAINSFIIKDLTGFQTEDGSVSVVPEGGKPSYSYEWRVNGTTTIIGITNTIDTLKAGDYQLTLTDDNGCAITQIYTISEPTLLEITSINQIEELKCFGDINAELIVNVTGGVPTYNYLWYNSLDATTILSTTATVSTIGEGNYVVEITDNNGIKVSSEITITQPEILNVISSQTIVSCNGGNDGSITLTVNGGTGGYSYFWSTGENSASISNLSAGNYSVTVKDENACEKVVSFTIEQPVSGISITNQTIINTTGNGLSNGSISVTVQGGTNPYAYLWTDASNTTLGSTTNELNNRAAGSYFLTITDDKQCAFGPVEYIIREPETLEVIIPDVSIKCFGETIELIATANGGVPDYKYSWLNSSNVEISTLNTSGLVLAGEYTLIVTDANNNENIQTYDLKQPEELLINNIIKTGLSCYNSNDGSISITPTGGTGSYVYSWSNNGSATNSQTNLSPGDYTITVIDDNTCSVTTEIINIPQLPLYDVTNVALVRPTNDASLDGSISITLTGGNPLYDYVWTDANGSILLSEKDVNTVTSSLVGLKEGTYTVTITDTDGCTITETYNLADPGELLLSVEQTKEISCFGGNDGELIINIVGGAGGNDYEWYDASNDSLIGTNETLSPISAGFYYVIVSNVEGISEQSAVFEVKDPIAVKAIASKTNPSCFEFLDGTITLNANGGSDNYEYRYRITGGNYTTWIAFDTAATSQIKDLGEARYDIQIRDTNGCFFEDNGTIAVINIELIDPELLLISNAETKNPTGFGLSNGSLEITAIGGTPNYDYEWSDANGVLSETSNTLSNISVGDYIIKITDSNGCVIQNSYTLDEPEQLLVTIDSVNIILCNGDTNGSLRAIPKGGIFPYQFEWFIDGDNTVIGTEQLLENIGANTYYVIITDDNNNIIQSANLIINQPEQLVSSFTSDYELCGINNDWEVLITPRGGTEPYTYNWSNGETTNSITGVLPGNYSVTITDDNGCTLTETIDLVPPAELKALPTIQNPTCFEGNNGAIIVAVSGGTPPYFYDWNTGETSASISNLNSGTYEVTVNDNKGCSTIKTYEVVEPSQLTVNLGGDVTLCVDQKYTLDATIADGTSYIWNSNNGFNSTEAIVEVSDAGTYTVISTNSQGCTATDEITINTSGTLISTEFLVSSQVFAKESFVIVDVSDPIPDAISWEFPAEAQIVEQSNTHAELLIETPGEYEVSLFTSYGECVDVQTKTILVLDPDLIPQDNSNPQSPMIINYAIYPNPSDGNFTIDIELREIQPATIKMFRIIGNNLVAFRSFEQSSSYQSTYNLNLQSGMYFVLLETPYATQLRKVIID